jgi:gliding motility-associated-like protein
VVPAQSGNYIVSGYNPGACELIPDTVSITIISTPSLPPIISNSPLCFGDTLEATTSLNGALTFTWDFNGGLVVQNDSLSVNGLAPGFYPITLFSNLGSCISPMATDTIQVLNPPQIAHQGPLETCGTVIDFNSAVQTDPSDPVQTILWYDDQGLIGNTGSINNVNSNAGAYSVETFVVVLETQNQCIASDTFSITFHPYPSVILSAAPQCDGESAIFNSQLAWVNNPPPSPNVVYSLSYGDGQTAAVSNGTHAFDSTGTYNAMISVTSDEGCSASDSVSFTIVAIPTILPTALASCGQEGSFTVELGLDNYTYDQLTWNIPGVGDFPSPSFSHVFTNPGSYMATVTLEGTNGCDFSESLPFTILPSVTIENLTVPNVITPNGDQNNDELLLDNLFVNCTNYDLLILNRWGHVVYEGTNTSTPFSGMDQNGKDIEAGVYFYKLTTNDNKVVHGHITVIR